MFLKEVDEKFINLAIVAKTKKEKIIVSKGLCEYIIVNRRVADFYKSLTEEKINEIHTKGKFTPLDIIEKMEKNNLCAYESNL